jgi:hypothetical protein
MRRLRSSFQQPRLYRAGASHFRIHDLHGSSSRPYQLLTKACYSSSPALSFSSSNTTTTTSSSSPSSPRRLLYEAPLAAPIKSLKRVSVTTAMLSLTIPPAMVFVGSDIALSGQIAVAATTMIASIGSTGAIHYLFSPYVLRLTQVLPSPGADEGSQEQKPEESSPSASSSSSDGSGSAVPPLDGSSVLEAHTMTLFGLETASQFRVDQVVSFGTKPPRPFVSFGASLLQEGGAASSSPPSAERYYFIHTSVFSEKKLLRHLLGRPLKDDER